MRYCAVAGAIGLGFLLAEISLAPGSAGSAAKNGPWLVDYATARRAARLSGKPIFVVFR
ncbi:MAG TPA: hypothetical protein VEL76_01255 [Gemmataceae bacterium]|nr:hypothetical protein [Gemmataceae bacterium]